MLLKRVHVFIELSKLKTFINESNFFFFFFSIFIFKYPTSVKLSQGTARVVNFSLNDTHWEKWCFTKFSTKIHWNTRLTASDVFHILHNQLISFNSIIVQMSEKRDSSKDSKNEWLLLSVTFTAKFELVFVWTFENAFA